MQKFAFAVLGGGDSSVFWALNCPTQKPFRMKQITQHKKKSSQLKLVRTVSINHYILMSSPGGIDHAESWDCLGGFSSLAG